MYLDFFSLKKFPFRITPDPSMFFPGGTNGPGVVLNALVYAVTSGEGIVKVVGEVGSGKTMLCRMLEERLPNSVEIVYLANPSLSARDIIYAIAFELDLDVDANTERLLVMHKLQDCLVKKHSEGGSVVVFIEEAQGMPIETLEEIRLLSNLETHRHKLMQIILFGQPELDKNLQGKSIRQLRERITHSFYLEPMTLEQISDYLHYRMQAAGCPWPKVFTAKAEKLLSKASEGLTRRANILADKSLMAAYASSSIQAGHEYGAVQQKILPVHVKAAIRDSGYGKRYLVPWAGVFSSIAVVVFAVFFYLGLSKYQAGLPSTDLSGQTADVTSVELASVPGPSTELIASGTVDSSINSNISNISNINSAVGTNNPQPEVLVSLQPERSPEPVVEAVSVETETEQPLEMAASSVPETSLSVENALIQNTTTGLNPLNEELAEVSLNGAESLDSISTAAEQIVPTDEMIINAIDTIDETIESRTDSPRNEGINIATVATDRSAVIPLQLEALDLSERTEQRYEPESATQTEQNAPTQAAKTSAFSGLQGLIGVRARASTNWLKSIAEENGYTVQMASFPVSDQLMLEEFLQLLSLATMLDETYLCLISQTSRRPAQWLVIHGDFSGLSRAREYIASLPAYSRQYEPYVRNSSGIACLSEVDDGAFLAF